MTTSTTGLTRTPYGYLTADGAVFYERGARMTDGGTAWIVWHATETVDETAYPAPRSAAEVTGRDDLAGAFEYVWEAGSLAEARATEETR